MMGLPDGCFGSVSGFLEGGGAGSVRILFISLNAFLLK
jgi:hypothetical protein